MTNSAALAGQRRSPQLLICSAHSRLPLQTHQQTLTDRSHVLVICDLYCVGWRLQPIQGQYAYGNICYFMGFIKIIGRVYLILEYQGHCCH